MNYENKLKEIIKTLGEYKPIFKYVFTTNDDRYLAVLPRDNKLPKHLQLFSQEIIEELEV